MQKEEFVAVMIPMIIGVISAVELFFYLPIRQYIFDLKGTAVKAIAVCSTSKISDHWKEKILPRYAAKILGSTLRMSFSLGVLVLTFGGMYGLTGVAFFENVREGFEELFLIETQLFLIGISIVYGGVRNRLRHG